MGERQTTRSSPLCTKTPSGTASTTWMTFRRRRWNGSPITSSPTRHVPGCHKTVTVPEVYGRAHACAVIEASIADYQEAFGE